MTNVLKSAAILAAISERRLRVAATAGRQHAARRAARRAASRGIRAQLPGGDRRSAEQGNDPVADHESALRAAAARGIHSRRRGLWTARDVPRHLRRGGHGLLCRWRAQHHPPMIDLATSEPARGQRAARRGGAGAKLCALLFGTALAAPAAAEMSAEELAKLAQNPVGNLISVPFQYNAQPELRPEKGTQSILNIQPVIPISVNNDWNIITRTILPVLWQPSLTGRFDHQRPRRPAVHRVPVAGQPGRMDLGRGSDRAGADTHQRQARQRQLGPRAVVRRAAPRQGQPVGVRRARQQRVVAGVEQRCAVVQQRADPAVSSTTTCPTARISRRHRSSPSTGTRRAASSGPFRSAAASARSSTSASCR